MSENLFNWQECERCAAPVSITAVICGKCAAEIEESQSMSKEDLRAFWDKSDRHDWHFPFSDDHRVYAAGLKAHEALKT